MSTPAAPRLELVLYVSAASPTSARAVANARRILRDCDPRAVSFTICDLAADPSAADHDQIAFTPTLFKRSPSPPAWIVGDLAHPEPLLELLAFHGVTPTHGHRKAHHRRSRV